MTLHMSAAATRAAALVGGPTPFSEPNWCQHWCSRTVYDDQGPYYWGGTHNAWAINMWLGAVEKGRVVKTSDPAKIPAGAMTFSKGASKYGHVFIADGKAGCYTTDFPVSRKIGHVKIADLMRAWGHTLLGYIEVTGGGKDFRDYGIPTPVPVVTIWDDLQWNVASPRWYTPWKPREAAIGDSIRGDASVNTFQEVYDDAQVESLMRALGANFSRVGTGGPGLEAMTDHTRWDLVSHDVERSGIQGRGLLKFELRRKATGRVVRFGTLHAPALYPDLRIRFGKWLEPRIADLDVITGDFNTSKNYLSPRANIRSKGFRDMREQCSVKNGGLAEFPSKGRWLADIYSRPDRGVKITYGELHLTTTKESDHRELTARIEAR